jgi:4-hydroxy-3-methylbut-2-enyl diphosphate reductase
MEVIRASVLGRCMGVRRAVELAFATAASEGAAGRPAFSLGPIIHNPRAVAELEAAGLRAIGEAELEELGQLDGRIAGSAVVIRAHGVPPELRRRIEELGGRIVDATCPRVIASQRKARELAAEGRAVILAGDRDHAEIAGIAGYAREGARERADWEGVGGGTCLVVGSAEEAASIPLPTEGRAAIIAQTTIKEEEYRAICEALRPRLPGLEVVDSICPATEERGRALAELAERCDAVVVVGGRNSANTGRLLGSARALGKPAWLVESATELPEEAFGYARVGLTAGASTPDELVAEVETALIAGAAR